MAENDDVSEVAATTGTDIAAAITSDSSGGITVYQTSPQRLTMHRIEDHELELLVNISRPVMLTLAGAFGGGFLGLLPSAIVAYGHVTSKAVSNGDLTAVLVCGACSIGVGVCGTMAVKAQGRATSTISEIRKRVAAPVAR